MSSLAEQRGRDRARPPQTPPGEDVRRGEGAPARPQRQGPHHGAGPRADAPNRGGEALRRADREVRRRARARCCGASTTPQSGRCFPSYERIAEKADCARATVYEAINALEARRHPDLGEPDRAHPGVGARPVRPGAEPLARHPHEQRLHASSIRNRPREPPDSSKSEFPTGTEGQELFPCATPALDAANSLHQALQRWGEAVKGAAPTGAARSLAV